MNKLTEIETKIAALRKRHAELDERLVPKRDGVFDGAVMSAMSVIDTELSRLLGLREKALVGDLISEAEQQPRPAPPVVPRLLPLPPDLPPSERPIPDPLEDGGLKSLPTDNGELRETWSSLLKWSLEEVNNRFRRRSTEKDFPGAEAPVRYTVAQHWAITQVFAGILAEMKMTFAVARDRRNALEKKLLARIEALEARPEMKYDGVWAADKVYGSGTFVTDQGCVWHAKRATIGERPRASDAWQLAVKSGRDGKDLR